MMTDRRQIQLWKLRLLQVDCRASWPRALSKAISMIRQRDAQIMVLTFELQKLRNPASSIQMSWDR
jgi:hypothetical protein